MSAPELIGDLAAAFLARTWHRQPEGAPLLPEHDPQVLAARMHLRPRLCQLIAEAGTDPEAIADALLAAGDIHSETRTEIAINDAGKARSGPRPPSGGHHPQRVPVAVRAHRDRGGDPMTATPSRIDLFRQARGDHDEYYRLCAEHGIAPDSPPKVLGPTGLPGATWPDQPTDSDAAVAALDVHHARGKERTDEEAAVLDRAAAQADARRARAEHAAVDIRPESTTERLRGQLDLGGAR